MQERQRQRELDLTGCHPCKPSLTNALSFFWQERERQRELELIKQQYLGAEKVKKKILKVRFLCSRAGAV